MQLRDRQQEPADRWAPQCHSRGLQKQMMHLVMPLAVWVPEGTQAMALADPHSNYRNPWFSKRPATKNLS